MSHIILAKINARTKEVLNKRLEDTELNGIADARANEPVIKLKFHEL